MLDIKGAIEKGGNNRNVNAKMDVWTYKKGQYSKLLYMSRYQCSTDCEKDDKIS